MQIPLSDREEAILQLLKQVRNLEEENNNLREELKQLYWRLQEHD
jgi:prefoldin subunit 5